MSAQFGQRFCRLPVQDHVEQIEHPAPIRQPEHRAHLIGGGFARAMGNRLIQKRHRIAHRAFGGAGDQRQRIRRDLRAFGLSHPFKMRDHHLGFDPAQVEALAAAENGHRHFANLGRGEDEFHMRGRLFERLEQRVEGAGREHMHLVDDIDLVARRSRPVMYAFDDLADVAHAGARGRVHLHHIDMAAFGDGQTMFALQARLGRGLAIAVGTNAVQPLGDDPRRGRFAGAPDAGHDEGLSDARGGKGVFQRAHHCLLPDQIGKGGGAVFAGEDLIAGPGHIGHSGHLD